MSVDLGLGCAFRLSFSPEVRLTAVDSSIETERFGVVFPAASIDASRPVYVIQPTHSKMVRPLQRAQVRRDGPTRQDALDRTALT